MRIFNLAESRVVTTLHVDVSTNHASISPDGKHLVVVGDSPEVYFYHPASTSRTRGGIGEGGCGSWVLASHPPISTNTKADTDALMSTSFSSSSLHCAVASQSGIITIFDTRYLACTDEKDGCSPIVRVITSSRPSTQSGAVRSVQFSPAPWDLLIWAEHCGRVCIADSRSNFTRRQVIDVLVEKDEVIEAEIEEVQEAPSAWEVSQSLLGNPTPAGASTHRYDDEDDFSSLSDTEQQAHINELAGLVLGDGPGEWIAARVRTLAPGAYFLPISHPELLTGSPAAMLRAASSGMPTSALLRDYRERYNERERARQRAHDPPRRRNSVHPSYTTDHLTASLSTPGPTSAAGGTTTTERERRMPRSNTLVMPPRQMEQFTGLLADQRRRQRRTGRLESETIPYAYYTGNGVDITGCTLAPDGRKL